MIWKITAIAEFLIILSGMASVFIYMDYRAGALPYSIKDILSLCASVAVFGLFLGGFLGWVIVLSLILDKRRKGA